MKLLFLYILILPIFSFGQHKQDYVWLLGIDQKNEPGNQAYRIDFKNTPFQITESNNGLGFSGNNASICDENGNLLFYCNGQAIFNKNALIIENGDSINYDKWVDIYNWSSNYGYPGINSIFIVKDPANLKNYYMIHNRIRYNGPGLMSSVHLIYSEIKERDVDELEIVTKKNQNLYDSIPILSCYLSAISSRQNDGWWFIQPLQDDSIFLTYYIGKEGIIRFPNQNTHQFFDSFRSSASGTARFSPDGKKYALYNYFDQLHIYDFDRQTGILSNHKKIIIHENVDRERYNFSGIEWSSNSRFIYTSSEEWLHQVDLENDFEVMLIDTFKGVLDPFPSVFSHMALGPDCRIYICPQSGTNSYHVINKPNEKGLACDFVPNGIKLPLPSGAGSWPNFPRYRVDEDEKCDPTITSLFGDAIYYRRELEVYPNPSSGLYTLKIPQNIKGLIAITSILGEVLKTIPINNNNDQMDIDITSFLPGNYNIELYPQNRKDRVFYSRQVVKI